MKRQILILTALALIASGYKTQTASAETVADGTRSGAVPAPAIKGAFSIQIKADSVLETIRKEKAKAEAATGHPVFMARIEPWYKLYIGDFATRAEANAFLPEVKRKGYKDAWIVGATGITGSARNAALEEAIVKIIKTFQNRDEKALNALIIKDFGIAYFYAPGIYKYMYMADKISLSKPVPDNEYIHIGMGFETDYKVRFEGEPDFSCDDYEIDKPLTLNWNKPPGIYCNTTYTTKILSSIAETTNEIKEAENDVWPAKQIKRFKEIEAQSYRVLVTGKEGGVFIFYVTFWQNEWRLMAIDEFDPCGA